MSEIKKCPFCGGEADSHMTISKNYIDRPDGQPLWFVECTNEECVASSGCYDTVEEAINAWNQRRPVDDVVETLKGAARLEITVHGGRCNGKTLALGYAKGIESAIQIVKENLK